MIFHWNEIPLDRPQRWCWDALTNNIQLSFQADPGSWHPPRSDRIWSSVSLGFQKTDFSLINSCALFRIITWKNKKQQKSRQHQVSPPQSTASALWIRYTWNFYFAFWNQAERLMNKLQVFLEALSVPLPKVCAPCGKDQMGCLDASLRWWSLTLATRNNTWEVEKLPMLRPTPEMLILLVYGSAWTGGFFKVHSVVLTHSQA